MSNTSDRKEKTMKKYIIGLLTACLLMTGCQTQSMVEAVKTEDTPIAVEEKTADEAPIDEADLDIWTLENLLGDEVELLDEAGEKEVQQLLDQINELEADDWEKRVDQLDVLYNELTRLLETYDIYFEFVDDETDFESSDDESEEYGYEPWTLKSYLGFEYDKLTDEQKVEAQVIIDKINAAEENYSEEAEDAIREIYQEMNVLLKTFGLKVPVSTIEDFAKEHPGKFTDDQVEKMIALDEKIMDLNENDPENEGIEELYEQLEKILSDAGFDADEVLTQIESSSVIYAKFKLDSQSMTFIGDKEAVLSSDMDKFRFIAERALKVISKEMRHYVQHILINSDGQANVLAYVRQENDELTKWRMVLDIKDAFDEKGDYIKEYDETIVHEFGHLLTLNASQMQDTSNGTYENEEGILSEKSYMNQFYQKFWPEIMGDYDESVDPYDPDSAYEFYERYSEQFVSDYAATNPEEDIAESFRIFVCFDKPEGNEISDQKVLWFYEFPEMVALRDAIRSNLGY